MRWKNGAKQTFEILIWLILLCNLSDWLQGYSIWRGFLSIFLVFQLWTNRGQILQTKLPFHWRSFGPLTFSVLELTLLTLDFLKILTSKLKKALKLQTELLKFVCYCFCILKFDCSEHYSLNSRNFFYIRNQIYIGNRPKG